MMKYLAFVTIGNIAEVEKSDKQHSQTRALWKHKRAQACGLRQ